MRVVLVTESFLPHSAPAASTVRHLVDRLVARGDRPLVVTTGAGPASFRGASVERTRAGDVRGLGETITRFAPDVVHVADPRLLGTAALYVARGAHLPTLVSLHDDPPTGTRRLTNRVQSRADLTLVETPDDLVAGAHVWQPGVDTTTFRPGLRDADLHDRWARRHKGEDRVVVGYCGSVDRPKVRRRLAEIADLPGVRLVVLGGGSEVDRLRRSASKVKVTGPLNSLDRARALACLDLLVVPSRRDARSHSAREALACGVPVVGVDCPASRAVVRDGHDGLLVGLDRLTGAVAVLAGDAETRNTLAARAGATRGWDEAAAELVERHYATLGSLAEPV